MKTINQKVNNVLNVSICVIIGVQCVETSKTSSSRALLLELQGLNGLTKNTSPSGEIDLTCSFVYFRFLSYIIMIYEN